MSDAIKSLDDVMKQIDDQFDQSVERLADLLRLESVSTDPAHDQQTAECAEFPDAVRIAVRIISNGASNLYTVFGVDCRHLEM